MRDLLRAYHVELVPTVEADSPENAAEASATLRAPVALKAFGESLVHKAARGAVALDLRSARDVRDAAHEMVERLGDEVRGFVVQPMVFGRREVIVGGTRKPGWGPLVMVGRGGVDTDVDPDRAWALAPTRCRRCEAMVRSLRTAPTRSSAAPPRWAPDRLYELVSRVSELVADLADVAELDLNPVLVGTGPPLVVDARVRVAPPAEVPWGRRGVRLNTTRAWSGVHPAPDSALCSRSARASRRVSRALRYRSARGGRCAPALGDGGRDRGDEAAGVAQQLGRDDEDGPPRGPKCRDAIVVERSLAVGLVPPTVVLDRDHELRQGEVDAATSTRPPTTTGTAGRRGIRLQRGAHASLTRVGTLPGCRSGQPARADGDHVVVVAAAEPLLQVVGRRRCRDARGRPVWRSPRAEATRPRRRRRCARAWASRTPSSSAVRRSALA